MSTKRSLHGLAWILILGLLFDGCSQPNRNVPAPSGTTGPTPQLSATTTVFTATTAAYTATSPPIRATEQAPASPPALTSPTPDLGGYPLSERGPYYVGRRNYELVDASRANRPVSIVVWYPALLSAGSNGTVPMREAAPDFDGAPYPVILSDTKAAGIFVMTLVSHGFAWVSVNKLDTYDPWDENLFLQPLDQLFALEQVSANPPPGLEGMLDTDHAGATGYSFGGYNALALGGPRLDPAFYLGACADEEATKDGAVPLWNWVCAPAARWDEFASAAGDRLTQSEDGLWQPTTDERIRAVLPLAGEGWWLYGAKGLSFVNRPTFIIAATKDGLYKENAWIFEQLSTSEKTFISFIGPSHMMIYEQEMVDRMAHFAVAFFGRYLQGKDELAQYYSEEFVSQHPDLAWGVYQGD